jgi:hypothetical protein
MAFVRFARDWYFPGKFVSLDTKVKQSARINSLQIKVTANIFIS